MCVMGVLLYVWTMLVCVRGQVFTNSSAGIVYGNVFKADRYNADIRPVYNDSETLEVSVYFELLSLHYLDEKTETFKATAYMKLEWIDEFLSWNETIHDVPFMTFPRSDIWTPDLVLTNSYHTVRNLGDEDLKVMVASDGTVSLESIEVLTSTCELDTTFFPFDLQTCSVNFVVWNYFREHVRLVANMEKQNTGLQKYETHPSWELQGTSVSIGNLLKSSINYSVTLKRKARYYIQNFLLPTVMLTILSLMTFLLPHDCGERASYSITVFLSMVVMLTILNSILPESSNTTCIFALYLIIETGLSTLMTIINIVLLRMANFKNQTEVPECLRAFVNCCCRETTISLTKKNLQEEILDIKEPLQVDVKNQTEVPECLRAFVNCCCRGTTISPTKKDLPEEILHIKKPLQVDWVDVVRSLDKLCFLCFLVVSSLVTFIMLYVCAAHIG